MFYIINTPEAKKCIKDFILLKRTINSQAYFSLFARQSIENLWNNHNSILLLNIIKYSKKIIDSFVVILSGTCKLLQLYTHFPLDLLNVNSTCVIQSEMNVETEELLKRGNGLWKNDSCRHRKQQIWEKEKLRRNDRRVGKPGHFRWQKGYHERRKGSSPLSQFLLPLVLSRLATTIPSRIRSVNAKSYLPWPRRALPREQQAW